MIGPGRVAHDEAGHPGWGAPPAVGGLGGDLAAPAGRGLRRLGGGLSLDLGLGLGLRLGLRLGGGLARQRGGLGAEYHHLDAGAALALAVGVLAALQAARHLDALALAEAAQGLASLAEGHQPEPVSALLPGVALLEAAVDGDARGHDQGAGGAEAALRVAAEVAGQVGAVHVRGHWGLPFGGAAAAAFRRFLAQTRHRLSAGPQGAQRLSRPVSARRGGGRLIRTGPRDACAGSQRKPLDRM